jgi:hypothetical protein
VQHSTDAELFFISTSDEAIGMSYEQKIHKYKLRKSSVKLQDVPTWADHLPTISFHKNCKYCVLMFYLLYVLCFVLVG